MPYTKKDMQLYKCHKEVKAQRIVRVRKVGCYGPNKWTGADIFLDNGACVLVDEKWLERNPKVAEGGYFVEYQQADFYTAYSPAAPFEQGYTKVPMSYAELDSTLRDTLQKLDAPTSFLDRMKGEAKELDERLQKLCAFCDSLKFKELADCAQTLMKAQAFAMALYLEALNERIKLSEAVGA